MNDPVPEIDLGALSAKLRAEDQRFRRTFALGQLACDSGSAPASPVRSLPDSPVRSLGGGFELRKRISSLIEARTGIEAGDGVGAGVGERLERLVAMMPAAALSLWLSSLEAETIDGPGWATLIQCLTVNETYFYRDPEQLAFIRRHLLAGLIAAQSNEPQARLTCWCAGCSTGEEVYTMAILIVEALREVGEAEIRGDGRILISPRWRIKVLGTDIDRAALLGAETGHYADFPMGPFRALPEALFCYFEATPAEVSQSLPGSWLVRPEIRELTNFMPANLAALDPPTLGVNLVLCRNVLIYLSDRVRCHAQGLFYRALGRNGTLALGPTDVLRRPEQFATEWGPGTVLYRKK